MDKQAAAAVSRMLGVHLSSEAYLSTLFVLSSYVYSLYLTPRHVTEST
jgi:hypothetical protein